MHVCARVCFVWVRMYVQVFWIYLALLLPDVCEILEDVDDELVLLRILDITTTFPVSILIMMQKTR